MGASGWPVIEFNWATPYAIVEYKATGARVDPSDWNNIILRAVADRAALPFFIVVYSQGTVHFLVVAVNDLAKELHPNRRIYDEQGYVAFLQRLRGIGASKAAV
jgi:hypothetical protein